MKNLTIILTVASLFTSSIALAGYSEPKKEMAHQLARAYLAGTKSVSTSALEKSNPDTEDNSALNSATWEFNIYSETEDCFVTVEKSNLDVKSATCSPVNN